MKKNWGLEEEIKEVEELWVPDMILPEEKWRIVDGYEEYKEYNFSRYGEVKLIVWKKGRDRLYEVWYDGITKYLGKSYWEAEKRAKMLANRCKALYRLLV